MTTSTIYAVSNVDGGISTEVHVFDTDPRAFVLVLASGKEIDRVHFATVEPAIQFAQDATL